MNLRNNNKSDISFNAILRLRGYAKGLPESQINYLKNVVSQIGTSKFDAIDMFVHSPEEGKDYTLIDIGGYINNNLKATHASSIGKNVYEGIVSGLKFLLEKVYNNEILEQFSNSKDKDSYNELNKFIKQFQVDIKETEEKDKIISDKLVIDGAIENLSKEEADKLLQIANMVLVSPNDKMYMFIRKSSEKDITLINMVGYVNKYLKTAQAHYKHGDVYTGAKEGISFIIEKLFGEQIKKTITYRLPQEKINKINQFLKKENIKLQI